MRCRTVAASLACGLALGISLVAGGCNGSTPTRTDFGCNESDCGAPTADAADVAVGDEPDAPTIDGGLACLFSLTEACCTNDPSHVQCMATFAQASDCASWGAHPVSVLPTCGGYDAVQFVGPELVDFFVFDHVTGEFVAWLVGAPNPGCMGGPAAFYIDAACLASWGSGALNNAPSCIDAGSFLVRDYCVGRSADD